MFLNNNFQAFEFSQLKHPHKRCKNDLKLILATKTQKRKLHQGC